MHNAERFHEGMVVPPVMLFDLTRDPLERENVADSPEYREAFTRLNDLLWSYLERYTCPILNGPIEHAVAHGIEDISFGLLEANQEMVPQHHADLFRDNPIGGLIVAAALWGFTQKPTKQPVVPPEYLPMLDQEQI